MLVQWPYLWALVARQSRSWESREGLWGEGGGRGGGGSAPDVTQRFLEEAEGSRVDLVVMVEFVERNLASAPLAALDEVTVVLTSSRRS